MASPVVGSTPHGTSPAASSHEVILFGATSHLGHGILEEALSRSHGVTTSVRDPVRLVQRHGKLTVVTGDVAQPASWLDAMHGADTAIASLSARSYRIGGDQLLVDANGVSRISVADHALALLDHLEKHGAPRQRITVAY